MKPWAQSSVLYKPGELMQERRRQEDKEFDSIFSYIASSRPVRDVYDSIYLKENLKIKIDTVGI